MTVTARTGKTLGRYLRAHRMRYGELHRLPGFMRLTILGEDTFRAEVIPADYDLPSPKGRQSDQSHVLWYAPDSKIRDEMERLCSRVLGGDARPVRLKQPVAFLFDGDGKFQGWAR